MKIIKFIFQATIVTVLSFIILFLIILGVSYFIKSTSEDSIDQPTTPEDSKPLSFTESPVQPERKPNISDKNYAQALMSHKREQITDINVLRDYDGVLRTVKTNIDNGVANQEDHRLLEIHNNVYGGQDND